MQQPSEITEAEENHKYSLYVSQDDVHGKPISDGGDWFSTTNQSGMLRSFSKSRMYEYDGPSRSNGIDALKYKTEIVTYIL